MDHLAHFNRLQNDLQEILARIASLNERKITLTGKIDSNRIASDRMQADLDNLRSLHSSGVQVRAKKAADAVEIDPRFRDAFVEAIVSTLRKEINTLTLEQGFTKIEHDNAVTFGSQELGDVTDEIKTCEYTKLKIERRITKCRKNMAVYLQKIEDESCR